MSLAQVRPADERRPAAVSLFRRGRWYSSLDQAPVARRPGSVSICLAPGILLRDDLRQLRASPGPPAADSATRRESLRRALELFVSGTVDIGGLGPQTPSAFQDILRELSGLPEGLVARWSRKLAERLDARLGRPDPALRSDEMDLVSLPSNTFLCLEACLESLLSGATLWMRPSRREPFSAARLLACLLAAGWPPGRLGLYACSHDDLPVLVRGASRAVLYGSDDLHRTFSGMPGVEVRGSGRACAVVDAGGGVDAAADWLLERIAGDAGRFCTNVGTILCLEEEDAIGRALAERLDAIPLRSSGTEERWFLTDWPEPEPAAGMAAGITARLQDGDRILTHRPLFQPCRDRAVLAPGLVALARPAAHPLLGVEVPFPFAVLAAASIGDCAGLTRGAQFVYSRVQGS